MKITMFWDLIATIDLDALEEGDEDSAYEELISALAAKTEDEINSFHEILCQALHDIDGQQWSEACAEAGESAEGFLYARSYVVARGREHYEEVLNDPEAMPKNADQSAESLVFVASHAWAELTEDDADNYDFVPSVDYTSGSNEAQW